MPKVHSVSLSLDAANEVYHAGEVVSGTWKLSVGDSFSVKGVRVALHGAAYARWEDDFDSRKDDKIGYEKFTAQWKTVFGTKLGENGPNHTLTAGEHSYKFSFRLPPDRIPSSYEGQYGAIRYWLLVQIDMPVFRFNIERYKGITVLDRLDVNAAVFAKPVAGKLEKTITKALVVGNQGTVIIKAMTDRGAYCPGEKIALTLVAHNNSEQALGPVKASLIQQVRSYASGDEKVKDLLFRTVTGKRLEKGDKLCWNGQMLTIDAIPPSTKARACHIVKVSYHVKVYVDIPKLHGGDAFVCLPITIGTVPQGYTPPPRTAGASNIEDVSSAITYTSCNAGFRWFQKGQSNIFLNFQYTPWCAYVQNFKFPVAQTVKTPTKVTAAAAAKPTPKAATPRVATGTDALSLIPQTPSAPPITDMNPPSYDSVMSGFSDFPVEQPNEEPATVSQQAETEPDSIKGAYLLVRFPDSRVVVCRTMLAELGARMYAKKGSIIALAPQVIVTRGAWPARTSIAVFMFETKENASGWFTEFSDSCSLQGLHFTDAMVGEAKGRHQHERSVFALGILHPPNDWRSPEAKEALAVAKQIGPLRQKHEGVSLVGTVKTDHLCGDWPAAKHITTLSQWQSMDALYKFKQELMSHEDMLLHLFTPETDIVFQTEDLAFIEERQPAATGEDHASDNRKEEL